MSDDTDEHYACEVFWDNLRAQKVISCNCGQAFYGDTWEEAGAEIDIHLEEHAE